MNVQKFDSNGHRIGLPARMKSTEEYLMLEKELATLLNQGGPVHYWGGHDSGVWVQSDGDQQTYSPWMRTNEACTELVVEHDVWATPYPIDSNKCYEGRFFYAGRYYAVYVPFSEHQSKTLAYRYAILLATVMKHRRILASIVPEERRTSVRYD